MKLTPVFTALTMALTMACSSAHGQQADNGLAATMSPSKGLTIIDGAFGQVSAVSRIIAVEPPWQEKWFWNNTTPVSCRRDGASAAMVEADGGGKFKLNEYSAEVSGNRAVVKFCGEMREDLPTELEYSAFLIPDFLVAGAKYTITQADGKKVSGEISADPTATDGKAIPCGDSITISGRFGTFVIDRVKGPEMQMVDRRIDPFEKENGLWFGVVAYPVKFGGKFDSEMVFTFTPNKDIAFSGKLEDATNGKSLPQTAAPELVNATVEVGEIPLITIPKSYEKRDGKFAAPGAIEVVGTDDARLAAAADKYFGASLAKSPRAIKVVVGEKSGEFTAPEQAEGYLIDSSANGIVVLSRTARGAFFGLQTLRDLPLESGFRIVDWPDMEMRSVHLLAAEGTPVFHKYLVENYFNRAKLNSIVLECEYVRWDSAKNLWVPKTLDKDGLREFLKVCEANYIEVIPLFQTLGHLEWFFQNGQNLEMAEDPATPYAYNVSHPGVYPAMEAILDEVIEVFKPKYVHIGHDEIDMIGRFPYQPENVKRGLVDVVYSDIMHYYDYLKKRGIGVMIWHDMIVTKTECPYNGSGMRQTDLTDFRAKLPKDIFIADWQYSGSPRFAEFPDVKLLLDEGYPVVGCTWYETDNVENFAKAVKKYNAAGLMGTTWTGYFSGWESFDKYFYQLAPYLRVGAWSWNVTDENKKINGDFHRVFSDMLYRDRAFEREDVAASGSTVDISKAANLEVSPASDPFMTGDDFGITTLEPGFKAGATVRVGKVEFKLPERDGKLAAIALRSKQNRIHPDSVTLKLDSTAEKLFLLNTVVGTIPPAPEQLVATVKLNYADGGTVSVPLVFGWNIGTLDTQGSPSKELNVGRRFDFGGRIDRSIWYTEIVNPEPEKEIASISIDGTGTPYYLFGLSLQK